MKKEKQSKSSSTQNQSVAHASLKYIKTSPYKASIVATLIRGLDVKNAEIQLTFCKRRIAGEFKKLLLSCVANAKNNTAISEDKLFVSSVLVGKAFYLKRFLPCGRGRSAVVKKKYSNIKIALSEKVS